MPKRVRKVGCIVYDPKTAEFSIQEPKAKGSLRNPFLKKAHYEMGHSAMFNPSSSDLQNMFGGGKQSIRQLYKHGLKVEASFRPPMTDWQKQRFAEKQERMK